MISVCGSKFCPVCLEGNPFSDVYDNENSWNENKFQLNPHSMKKGEEINYENKFYVDKYGEKHDIIRVTPRIQHISQHTMFLKDNTKVEKETPHWMCSKCALENETRGKPLCIMCREKLEIRDFFRVRTESLAIQLLRQDNNKTLHEFTSSNRGFDELINHIINNNFIDMLIYVNSVTHIATKKIMVLYRWDVDLLSLNDDDMRLFLYYLANAKEKLIQRCIEHGNDAMLRAMVKILAESTGGNILKTHPVLSFCVYKGTMGKMHILLDLGANPFCSSASHANNTAFAIFLENARGTDSECTSVFLKMLSTRNIDGFVPADQDLFTTDMAKKDQTNPFQKTTKMCLIILLQKIYSITMITNTQNALFFIDVRKDYELEIKPKLKYLLLQGVDAKLVSELGLTPITALLNQMWYVEDNHNVSRENRVLMIQNAKLIIKTLLDHGTDFTKEIKNTHANVFDFVFRLGAHHEEYNEINSIFQSGPFSLSHRKNTIRIDNRHDIAVNENTCRIPIHSWPISIDGCVLQKPAKNCQFPEKMEMNFDDYKNDIIYVD